MILWCLALAGAVAALAQTETSAGYVERATRHLQSGQPEAAADEFSQAIRLRLDNENAWIGRGKAYTALGRYSAAIDDFDQALRLNPAVPDAYVERGYAYGRVGDF